MDARYTGEQIAAARRAKGLTQKQLADALGVTDKAVSKWERGLNYPDIVLFPVSYTHLDVYKRQMWTLLSTRVNAWALWAKAAAAKARWPKPSSASTTRTRAPYCWTAWILPR